MDNDFYDVISSRLNQKREELREAQDSFINTCKADIDSYNFEINAICDLIIMQRLKAEIKEMKQIIAFHVQSDCDCKNLDLIKQQRLKIQSLESKIVKYDMLSGKCQENKENRHV